MKNKLVQAIDIALSYHVLLAPTYLKKNKEASERYYLPTIWGQEHGLTIVLEKI